jgi:hypothetical protein
MTSFTILPFELQQQILAHALPSPLAYDPYPEHGSFHSKRVLPIEATAQDIVAACHSVAGIVLDICHRHHAAIQAAYESIDAISSSYYYC